MLVQDLMKSAPHSVPKSATVLEALELMMMHSIRHVPVVEGDKLVGLVSERDILVFCEPTNGGGMQVSNPRASLDVSIVEIMTNSPACVQPNDSVMSAIDKLLELKIGALPVVSPDQKLVGILSYVDILEESRKFFND